MQWPELVDVTWVEYKGWGLMFGFSEVGRQVAPQASHTETRPLDDIFIDPKCRTISANPSLRRSQTATRPSCTGTTPARKDANSAPGCGHELQFPVALHGHIRNSACHRGSRRHHPPAPIALQNAAAGPLNTSPTPLTPITPRHPCN